MADDMDFDGSAFDQNDPSLGLDNPWPNNSLYDTQDNDTLFGTQGNDMDLYSGRSFTPAAWASTLVDTPGMFATARTDSSATAIRTGPGGEHGKPRSAQSSTSPDTSSQDSPSSSQSSNRRKRKSPTSQESNGTKLTSTSSGREGPSSLSPTYGPNTQAALAGAKNVMHNPMNMPSTLAPEMAFEQGVADISSGLHDSNIYDFGGASSSPGAFGNANFGAMPRTMGIAQPSTMRTSGGKQPEFFFGSREHSPLDAMDSSQNASPAALFSTESSGGMVGVANDGTFWPGQVHNPQFDISSAAFISPSPVPDTTSPSMATVSATPGTFPCHLNVKHVNHKSRVETQIQCTFTMYPFPQGVTKVHLQSYTISKPKWMAKSPQKSPDTLELHTYLVCTSAMQKPGALERAKQRAAGPLHALAPRPKERRSSAGSSEVDSNDPDAPLNGGEVKICSNCTMRENKREARKKMNKHHDEEERWHSFEHERAVVFNIQEYQDWQPTARDSGFGDATHFPENSMQVGLPMRIACYCRHQNEKQGYMVIFTIRDHQDRVLAQAVSDSILITDDHKTQPASGNSRAANNNADVNFGAGASGYSPEVRAATIQQQRQWNSVGDLQALRQMQFQPGFAGFNASQLPGSTLPQASASTSATPRNSRPASPTLQGGSSKRRKGSSVHVQIPQQIPQGLRMTPRIPTGSSNPNMPASMGNMSLGPMSAGAVPSTADFGMTPMNAQHFGSNPTTPNGNVAFINAANRSQSNDNLQSYYSTPHSQNPSRGPSRAPSPVMSRPHSRAIPVQNMSTLPVQNMQTVQQQQLELSGQTMNLAFQTNTPTLEVVRVNPKEGPLTGNIQVDIQGKDFHPNVHVYFGEKCAQTTFWNDGALHAILPPGDAEGPVEVTVRDPAAQGNSAFFPTRTRHQSQWFKYVDDQQDQLWESVGKLMYLKEHGRLDQNHARMMVNNARNGQQFGFPNGGSGVGNMPTNFGGYAGMQRMSFGNTEEAIMGLLNVIDQDDSPYAPNFDIRYRQTGTTMLALASGLGYHRLAAALIARGATIDVRDKCGYTPLMIAAMRGHDKIVKLLARRGADPAMRNNVGATALELASTPGVVQELKHTNQHVRVRSMGGTPLFHSRANSMAFADPMRFEMTGLPNSSDVSLVTLSGSDSSNALQDEDDCDPMMVPSHHVSRHASRRPSAANTDITAAEMQQINRLIANNERAGALVSSLTSMRDQIAAQVNNFQHSVGEGLLSVPGVFPDYIAPSSRVIVRRFSSMMQIPDAVRDSLFFAGKHGSDTASTPPPPYEEKDPAMLDRNEKAGVVAAAAEAALDETCERAFGSVAVVGAAKTAAEMRVDEDIEVRFGGKTGVTREQQARLRLAHQARLKRGTSDWKVWVIWLPLLIAVLALIGGNVLPEIAGAFGALRGAVGRVVGR